MEAELATHASWRIELAEDGSHITAKFVGPTPTSALPSFLAALSQRMPEAHARVVFDLTELEGYNPEIKEPIKAWLLERKLAIDEVVVVVPRSQVMVRMVTAAVGMAIGIKIKVRDELELEREASAVSL
jgi:hypothetical protein